MQLLLLRHADADTPAPTDSARALSEKGREQAKRVGRFCASFKICPEVILASPLLRASETAQIVAQALDLEVESCPFLASGMTPAIAIEELRAYAKCDCVMIVGHEPDFSQLAATLLGLENSGALHVRKAALLNLEIDFLREGGARLDFLIPAKLM